MPAGASGPVIGARGAGGRVVLSGSGQALDGQLGSGILARAEASWSAIFAPEWHMHTPKRKTMLRRGAGGRAAHDVGGLEFGAIDRTEHDLALWEKRTDAMLILLVGPKKAAFAIDAHRRVIEDYGQQTYDRITYYQKWIRAIRNLIVEQGIVSRAEIEARLAEVRARFAETGRQPSTEDIPW